MPKEISVYNNIVEDKHTKLNRLKQHENAYLVNPNIAVEDVVREISSHLNDYDLVSLSSSSAYLFSTLQPDILKRAGRRLWQAIIDSDREHTEKIRKILQAHPELLCTPSRKLFTHQELKAGLQSQLTWQTFLIKEKKPLSFAIQRNQVEIVEIIVKTVEDAGDKLTDEQRQEVMQQWEAAETNLMSGGAEQSSVAESTGAWIPTPKERSQQFNFQELIDVIKQETFPNGFEGPLSEATESVFEIFRQTVLPKDPVILDTYYDIDQLLMHAYAVYVDAYFDPFQTLAQRNLFCIKVIGYIQSLLSPEVAQVFCEGLCRVVEEGRQISFQAHNLQLWDDHNFYRPACDCSMGLGFKYVAGEVGDHKYGFSGVPGWLDLVFLRKLYQAKTTKLEELKDRLQNCLLLESTQGPTTQNHLSFHIL